MDVFLFCCLLYSFSVDKLFDLPYFWIEKYFAESNGIWNVLKIHFWMKFATGEPIMHDRFAIDKIYL